MRALILLIPLLLLGCVAEEQQGEANVTDNITKDVPTQVVTVENDTQQALSCTCSQDYQPVCGADNRTYQNRCNATCAGISILYEGACQPPTPLCSDSDGDDMETRGTVSAGGLSYTDTCEGLKVKEYVCSSNKAGYTIIECSSGHFCKDGRCIKGEPDCTDSDGGYDIYRPGTLKIRSLIKAEYLDKCLSKTTLREYYCENDEMVTKDVRCEFGCLQASCNVQ